MVESERFAWRRVVALLSRGSEVETIAHVLARPDPPPIIESPGGGVARHQNTSDINPIFPVKKIKIYTPAQIDALNMLLTPDGSIPALRG